MNTAKPRPAQFTQILILLQVTSISILIPFLSFLPLDEMARSVQTGKFIYFSFGVITIAFLSAIKTAFSSKLSIKITIVDAILLLLLGLILCDRYLFKHASGFSQQFNELLGLSTLYILVRTIPHDYYRFFFMGIICSGLIQITIGFLQKYGHYASTSKYYEVTGSFLNPGPYAGFLSTVFPVALGMLFYWPLVKGTTHALVRYVLWFAVITIPLAVLISGSRAGILALITASLFILSRKYQLARFGGALLTKVRKRVVINTVIVTLVMSLTASFYFLKKDSSDGRILIWKVSSAMIGDSLLSGCGFDNFKSRYMNYQADYFRSHPTSAEKSLADDVLFAFNDFLQFTCEHGLPGILLLATLLYALLLTPGTNPNDNWLFLSQAGIMAMIVFAFFSYPSQVLLIKLNILFFLAAIGTHAKNIGSVAIIPTDLSTKITIRTTKILLASMILAGSIFTAGYVKTLSHGYDIWEQAARKYQSGSYNESANQYRSVADIFNSDGLFLMQYGKALSVAGQHEQAIEVLEKSKIFLNISITQIALGNSYKALKNDRLALENYWQASFMVPDRFYPKFLLAKLYYQNGQREEAFKLANEIINKKPKIESIAVVEMKEEMEEMLKGQRND